MPDLAPYAVDDTVSRGRGLSEPPPKVRAEFQRDRDRIVHSTAFRRLEYKTQVFVNHEGDLFRTRLTHSIEVAQIARSIARALHLNDDLAEAIALAHDLGHTPFGHAGQDVLNECMRDDGGFEHNLQSLRIVDTLEQRYAAFDGLNLMFETREGILKHCSPARARTLGELGRRFLEDRRPSLEAQICNLADEIAYNNHDIDDGLRAGLLSERDLTSIRLYARHSSAVEAEYPGLARRRHIHETIRRMIDAQVTDLLAQSEALIANARPRSVDEVRNLPPLIAFSPTMAEENREMKMFLRENLYRNFQVLRMTYKARRILSDLFSAFTADKRLLPTQYQELAEAEGVSRAVADYIAGMTDRYAIKEFRRLYAVDET